MKRTLILLLVLVILLAAVVPAAAQGPMTTPNRLIRRFILTGKVTAVDVDAGKITVDVLRILPPEPSSTPGLVLTTNRWTVFRFFRPQPATTNHRPSIRDVQLGEKIMAYGFVIGPIHLARLVILRLPDTTAAP